MVFHKFWRVAIGSGLTICLATCVLAEENHKDLDNSKAAVVKRVGNEIRFLADDELKGRGPDSKGLQQAADYIRDQFKAMGLKSGVEDDSYFQPFKVSVREARTETCWLKLTGPDGQSWSWNVNDDFTSAGRDGKASGELVFVGYGIAAPDLEFDEYSNVDVKNKIVVMIRREPQQDSESSRFDGKAVSTHSHILTKAKMAQERGAAAVLFINDPFTSEQKGDLLTIQEGLRRSTGTLPFLHVSQEEANELFAACPIQAGDQKLDSLQKIEAYLDETLKPVSQPLAGWQADVSCVTEQKQVEVVNVVGVLEGEGPHADETIIIGGHYDHLGYGAFGSRSGGLRAIHNGADDNASGTVAVLELARRFAADSQAPGRRLVFIAFTAEEKGLLGARHYAGNPLFPLEQTVTMLNFDMIGQVRDNQLLVYGSGTAPQFEGLFDPANQDSQLKLMKMPGVMAASDHWPFYQKSIPCFHIFSGMTDIYHTPEDDYETLNIEGVARTIDFTHRLLEGIAGLDERPEFAKASTVRRPSARPGVMNLGIIPDYTEGADQVRVTQVRDGSLADKAGIKKGDTIAKINDTEISKPSELVKALTAIQPGQTFKVVIRRDSETIDLEIKRPER